jgi:demethylmenaquinone methyltransferase/2-methoxy-6-polyprenyl-1,4-benzoquinol methylase
MCVDGDFRDACAGVCEKCNEVLGRSRSDPDVAGVGEWGEVGFRMGTTYTEPESRNGQAGRCSQPPRPLYVGDKERYVREMFAAIAPRYDLLNDLLSFRSHKRWRRLAVQMAQVEPGDHCLDVCTGTGDFAVDLAQSAGGNGQVVGADFCEPMIRNGLDKVAHAGGSPIRMMVANVEHLPYPDSRFDVATVGFGIRNVAHIEQAVAEMARVVRPGGRVVILEFNRPREVWYKPFVDFYLFHILPRLGGLFSRQEAYTYLPESMKLFVSREELASIMQRVGLCEIQVRDLNFGTVCIHLGTRPVLPGSEGTL